MVIYLIILIMYWASFICSHVFLNGSYMHQIDYVRIYIPKDEIISIKYKFIYCLIKHGHFLCRQDNPSLKWSSLLN